MEIMSTSIYRFSLGLVACFCFSGINPVLAAGSGATIEVASQRNAPVNLRVASRIVDANSEAALLGADPNVGYVLSNGATTLLVSLSKIENIDIVSCVNRGAKGDMVVSISNTRLPLNSPRWRQVAKNDLAAEAVKARIGPSEAKYVKVTFNVTEPGRISALGIYSASSAAAFAEVTATEKKDGNLLAANTTAASDQLDESDGKTVQEGKDFKDAKDIPAEGLESPAEGPPPGLPDPPPFTFVPQIVPTSP